MHKSISLTRTFIINQLVPLVKGVIEGYQQNNLGMLSAALAYFSLFSLFPLLLLILSIVGLFLGNEDSIFRGILHAIGRQETENLDQILSQIDAYQEVFDFISTAISPDVALLIDQTLHSWNAGGVEASIIGAVILIWVASNIFVQIDRSFQLIWGVVGEQFPNAGRWVPVFVMVRRRLIAFGLVMLSALLLLVALVTRSVLSIFQTFFPGYLDDSFWNATWFGSAFGLLFLILLLLFKYLPNTQVAWRDVWLGALMSAILISLLSNVSSWFIGNRNFLSYGVVGSIMALVFWIYLSSVSLYLGVVFTRVYASMFGSQHQPDVDMRL